MKLTAEQIATFERDGVVELGRVLSEEEVAEARIRFERVFAEYLGVPGKGLRNLYATGPSLEEQKKSEQRHYQMFNIWQHDEWYRALLYKEDLLDKITSVIGPNVQLLHDQVFYKPAGDGAPSNWHQDNSYFHLAPPRVASIWIALDDVDLENSCLHFLPGSHGELLPHRIFDKTYEGIELTELKIDESKVKPFPMPVGHALMHHCMTVHGAYANRSNRDRRSLGLHYMATDVRNSEGQLLENREKYPVLRTSEQCAAAS